jgi:hypothetical protein
METQFPFQPIGRAVATVLMIAGFASLSLLTGIIASAGPQAGQQEAPDLEKLDSRLAEIERLLRAQAE